MTNYIIENGINFYDEINNLDSDEDDEKRCLISNEVLKENSVKLLCNHEFNYMALYNEIYNQKYNSKYNGFSKNLMVNQLVCPFCRNMQNKLLPCIKDNENIPLTHGVNYPHKYCMYNSKCKYRFKSGKRKNEECGKECNGEYCFKHKKQIEKKSLAIDAFSVNYKSNDKNICCAIIKHGKNAGKQCTFKAKENGYCGKHTK